MSSYPNKSNKFQFRFKTVKFGGDDAPSPAFSTTPVRVQSANGDLPFILSNVDHLVQSKDTKTYIKRHVMKDHFSKGKKDPIVTSRILKPRQKKIDLPGLDTKSSKSTSDADTRFRVLTLRLQQENLDLEGRLQDVESQIVDRYNSSRFPTHSGISGSTAIGSPRTFMLGAGRIDPFDTYPIEATWESHELIDHFVSVIAPALIPLPFCTDEIFNPLRTIWMRYSIDDSLMFRGLLVVASVHLETLTQRPSSAEALLHESSIVQTLKDRIGNDMGFNDSTIVAVTLLAASESIRGNATQLLVHVSALEKMIELRGGLPQLGLNGLLQMTLTWVDLTTAAMVERSPRWPHIKCTNSISKELYKAMRDSLRISTRNPETEMSFIPGRDLKSIFHNLVVLSVMLSAARSVKRVNYSSVYYFCSMRFYLEHCLLTLEPSVVEDWSQRVVDELVKTVSLLYLHRVLREFQPQVGVLVALKKQVMQTLQSVEEGEERSIVGTEHVYTMLWILFCTGTCFVGEEEKRFFAERIAILTARLNLRHWNEVETVLARFLWITGMCKEKVEALWIEVENYGQAAPWLDLLI